jgi:hypothetical protein
MRQDKEQKVCGVRLDLLTFYERMKKGTEKGDGFNVRPGKVV